MLHHLLIKNKHHQRRLKVIFSFLCLLLLKLFYFQIMALRSLRKLLYHHELVFQTIRKKIHHLIQIHQTMIHRKKHQSKQHQLLLNPLFNNRLKKLLHQVAVIPMMMINQQINNQLYQRVCIIRFERDQLIITYSSF